MDQIGSNWIKLDQIGSDWVRLDQIGSDRVRLVQIGSDWIKWLEDDLGLSQSTLDTLAACFGENCQRTAVAKTAKALPCGQKWIFL